MRFYAQVGSLLLQGGSKFPERSSGWKAGMAMQKTYVLDTNILIQAPYALESFEDNHIVLPLAVLEALDELQQAEGDQGGNARQVIRYLEQMRLRGNLVEGVALPGGGTLRLEVNHVNVTLPHGMNPDSSSSRVL